MINGMLPPLPPSPLVTTAWLDSVLSDRSLRILDASWYLAESGRSALTEYQAGHIPGALFFDLDAASASTGSLPHMLPEPEAFSAFAGALGITPEMTVVVYDGSGVNLSAPRAWWMFRHFGHRAVAVLDGGLGKWRREGRRLEAGMPGPVPPGRFVARPGMAGVRRLADLRANLIGRQEQVVDARSADRFAGAAPEPRPGLRAGHIPGSRSLPYTDLIDPGEGTMLPVDTLRARFAEAGVAPERPVVATCGSGVTACSLVLALELLGRPGAAVYDGSWSEWGAASDVPVATGPAGPDLAVG